MLTVLKFLVLVVCSIIAFICHYKFKHRKYFKLIAKLPQIGGHYPFVGIGYKFFNNDNKTIFKNLRSVMLTGPSPRTSSFGPMNFVVIDDPDQVHQVLLSKNCVDKTSHYEALVFKNGLLAARKDMWKMHRKILEPAFNANVLKSFLPKFNEKTLICMKNLTKLTHGSEFNIFDVWASLALDNILYSATGVDGNIQVEKNNQYLEHCKHALRIIGMKPFKIWSQIKPIYKLSHLYRLEQKHIVNGFFKKGDEIIAEKEKSFLKDSHESESSKASIDLLMKSREKLSFDEIRDEVNTIIITGFMSVSTTVSMVCLLAAMHSRVQEKINEELQTVFATIDEEVTDEQMKKLTYLDYVIKETLRFWPSVPIIARCLSDNMEIGGFTIPSGANISFNIMNIHRNKKHWGDDADEFKPERFEPQNFEKVNPNAFIPFLKGPRNCIGYKYAMNSMKVILAHFFRNYKVSTSLKLDEIEFEFTAVTKVAQGYMVTIEKNAFLSSS